jgi:ATP-dependent Clp endopeptidase proteolytic subunit ClpP
MSKWFDIVNKGNGEADEIYIYGAIVDEKWDETDPEVTPIEFQLKLQAVINKDVKIFINSPGGNVFAGLAIYHMLKRHPANKTCYVDGMCASISSVIAMACNKIVAPKTSLMLVHKPLIAGYVYGNAIDLRTFAEELDKVETVIVEAYTAKTGLTAEKIREVMEKDAYMTGEEAVSLGFADVLDDSKKFKASIDNDQITINNQSMSIKNYKGFPVDKFKNLFIQEAPEPEPEPKNDLEIYELEFANNLH